MFLRREPTRNWKLILVPHTHWDREWYLPFQEFRAVLVEAVDSLLDIMSANPEFRYFTLDGQTIILEDYLEVRPEREDELKRRIQEGRILVGPWYVMPDEFLVSGESLIRNYLEGQRTAARFGSSMDVGYLPDTFGHIAQMPQLLRGLGMDTTVLWRGVGKAIQKSEASWVAPDGSSVLLEYTPVGYANAALLPTASDPLMERLSHIREQLEPHATTNFLLLMNGDDHMHPQRDLPAIIQEANRRLRDAELVLGTLPIFLDGMKAAAAASGVELETIEGELRSCETAHLLAGVLSSRMEIKQRNFNCETLLERWAEPFTNFAALLPRDPAAEQPRSTAPALLRLAWRYLLKNQPHDSICGCSIDQVHQEMQTRYDSCEQIGNRVLDRAVEAIAAATDSEAILGNREGEGAVTVFNSEEGPRTDFVEATAQLPGEPGEVALVAPDGSVVPYQVLRGQQVELASSTLRRSEIQGYLRLAGPGRDWPRWKLRILEKIVKTALRDRLPQLVVDDMDVVPGTDPSTVDVAVEVKAGREHNYDALSTGLRQLSSLVDRGDAQLFRLRIRRRDQFHVGFVAPRVPAHGLKLFRFEVAAPPRHTPLHNHGEATIENESLSLQVSPEDGTARLIDRETGAIFWGLNSFVDVGDAGDEYTYSPPTHDRIVEGPDAPPSIVLEESGPARQRVRIEMELRLPKGLSEDRQSRAEETVLCRVVSRFSIYPGVPRVDVHTTVTNRASDHRLRVRFPTQLDARFSHADGQFAVIHRPIAFPPPSEGWVEKPTTSNPQLNFVDLSDGESGLMIANRGLPEYEVEQMAKGPCLSVTLLRCIGWLSRDDLSTRTGAAGPLLPTPGAQMPGIHSFDYSIIPHAGEWDQAASQAFWFARPLRSRWTGRHPGPIGQEASFLALSPSSLQLSAVKQADDGSDTLIVRLYNML
ncbi:MAG TPA: glycoside hydrolase family 38 C-terminal domain-containing protein, partial [Chloroflexota bacterium]|nr:glycoside hydrolase family 38 C-terminal domain-containing protein [Chloroflexota bacterium]